MTGDQESQLYSDMADLTETVPKLKSEIKSLKGKLTKLTNRVEFMELAAFQDQITNLNANVDSANTNILNVATTLATHEIDSLWLHMDIAINLKFPTTNKQRRLLKQYISAERTSFIEKAKSSHAPIELLYEFRKVCQDCSAKHDLGAFAHKP